MKIYENFRPINVSIDNMHKFEENKMMKMRGSAQISWSNQGNLIINYISKYIKGISGVKKNYESFSNKYNQNL